MGVAKALARLLKCAYSSELSLLAHAIKPPSIDCVAKLSMTSKCKSEPIFPLTIGHRMVGVELKLKLNCKCVSSQWK